VKKLWSEHGRGDKVRYFLADNDEAEAHWVATDLLRARNIRNLKWADFGVLYRTNAQSRVLEDALRVAGIPYRLIGGTRFYDRKEVRDLVAYLRVVANPSDEAAWRRILNYPQRGIGDTTIQKMGDVAREKGVPFWRLVHEPPPEVTGRAREALAGLDALMARFRKRFEAEPLADACKNLITDVRFADELARTCKDGRELRRRMDNLEEVVNALAAYQNREAGGTLDAFLTKLSLDTRKDDEDADPDQVTMMTLHSAKGLEFTVVYLCGVEEGLMPHQRVLDGEGDLAEERRLAYVGITRARKLLTLSGAKTRLKFGRLQRRKPSRFLLEIPEALLDGGHGGEPAPLTPEEREKHVKSAFDAMEDLLR
jgi:superfamily I DNA/RNA helicase